MDSNMSVGLGQHQNTVVPSVYNPTQASRTPYRWSDVHDDMRYNQHPKNCCTNFPTVFFGYAFITQWICVSTAYLEVVFVAQVAIEIPGTGR